MKLSTEQKAGLDRLAELHGAYRAAQATARAEIARLVEKKTEAARAQRDILAFQLRAAKVPLRQIGIHGLGTTDPKTVRDAVANGERMSGNLAPLALDPTAHDAQAEPARPMFTGWRANPGTDPATPTDAHPFLFDWTSPENPAQTVTASYNPATRQIDIPALWAPPGEVDVDHAAIAAFQADDVQSAAKAWCQAQAGATETAD